MQQVFAKNFKEQPVLLDDQEIRHIHKVLRKKLGDVIFVTDGNGTLYEAEILSITTTEVLCSVKNETFFPKNKPFIHIAIAPTKNMDKIEWFLEKASEMGVDEISFVICKNSERKDVKNYDRLDKILIAACKQSKNYHLPILHTHKPFKDFIKAISVQENQKYIAYCSANTFDSIKITATDSILLIGPEGDFSPEEIDLAQKSGFQSISLGKHILRTETAGIFIASMFYYNKSSR